MEIKTFFGVYGNILNPEYLMQFEKNVCEIVLSVRVIDLVQFLFDCLFKQAVNSKNGQEKKYLYY